MINLGLMGCRLRQARINADLNQEEAAEVSGISIRSIRRSESKGTNNLSTLLVLCETYSVSITDIIGRKNDLNYLASAIRRLGPNACDVLISLCESMDKNNR
ncbi:MAG: helix-turn-helix domain-containing protein [Candidatus Thiodiazotropha sp. (ex Dulcina madagascariensis)]|nr:helix-turn-helix domain-containing protein [Candidatus Thiodiazotropha sp. (ex Dulcina madagascariensis)]